MSDVARAFAQMLTKSPDVPEHVIAGLIASGAEAIEPLVAVLNDRSLDASDHPSGGFARPHAAELLGHLADVSAIDPLVQVLVADRAQPRLVKAVADALARLHEALEGGIAGALLDHVDATDDVRAHMMLAMVLASGKMQDARTTELLRTLLPQDPDIVLPLVTNYADPALAPDVAKVLLDASGQPKRAIQAVHTLAVLGHRHPKLDELARVADDTLRHEVAREVMLSMAPHLAVLAFGQEADQRKAAEAAAAGVPEAEA